MRSPDFCVLFSRLSDCLNHKRLRAIRALVVSNHLSIGTCHVCAPVDGSVRDVTPVARVQDIKLTLALALTHTRVSLL